MKPYKSHQSHPAARLTVAAPNKNSSLENPIISLVLQQKILHFMEFHPADRFARNLRTMLIEFLMSEGAVEVNYLEDLLYDLLGLFEILEAIHKERGDEAKRLP